MARQRLLVIQVAALGYDLLTSHLGGNRWNELEIHSAQSVTPAVTCPVQATMRTGALPSDHGMVFNGTYLRDLRKPSFWEQSSALVSGSRIWDRFRQHGGTVGMLFWQQSLGENVDILLSPAPIHTHGGGLIDTVYSQPEGLYEQLCAKIGFRFKLSSYWGPLSRFASSEWISLATQEVMRSQTAPDLLFTYLPHLDYDLQKYGSRTKKANRALIRVLDLLQKLSVTAAETGYDVVMFGDYAIGEAMAVRHPNRVLREAGLMKTRSIRGRLYPDFHASEAFAVVDHEAAHVYLRETARREEVAGVLQEIPGVADVLTGDTLEQAGLAHPHSGEIVLIGDAGTWFAYPWWETPREAPDYATHIDIHNKPGYDPCELFFGWHPFAICTDPGKVRGTHGRAGSDRKVAWSSTVELGSPVESLPDLARAIERHLDAHAD